MKCRNAVMHAWFCEFRAVRVVYNFIAKQSRLFKKRRVKKKKKTISSIEKDDFA
jgi:hypothetical protein